MIPEGAAPTLTAPTLNAPTLNAPTLNAPTLTHAYPSGRIPEGASEVEVESWETGEPVKIKLDPLVGGPVKVNGYEEVCPASLGCHACLASEHT